MSRQQPAKAGGGAGASWRGELFLWGGRGLYLGPASATTTHAHHAVQVCVAIDGRFRLRPGSAAAWRQYRGAVVASDRPHQLDGLGRNMALLYLDPESTVARRVVQIGQGRSLFSIPPSVLARVLSCARATRPGSDTSAAAASLCEEMLQALVLVGAPGPPLDPRVARALDLLRTAPDRHMRSGDLAARVGISPSRLAHLFRAHTGLPVRRYLLWLRLGDALAELGRGVSLTTAAHAAGFADSAHFTRTCRRMLGITPSALRSR